MRHHLDLGLQSGASLLSIPVKQSQFDAVVTQATVVDGGIVNVVAHSDLGDVLVRDLGAADETMARWLKGTAAFVEEHTTVMELAYHVVGPRRTLLWLVLLKTSVGFQRVHLEELECAKCRTKVNAANPTIVDLYPGLPSEYDALDRGWAHPAVGCPVCGAELPRRAIWAEVVSKKRQRL
jgi:hypothetical protein